MKNKSIRLSEKHGVNPSMASCFWCGEVKEIVLFGRLKGDKEAPRQVCMDYEPCDKCQQQMNQGVAFIEASETPNEAPQIQKGIWPTGKWAVLKKEAVYNIISPRDLADDVVEKGKCFVPKDVFSHLFN